MALTNRTLGKRAKQKLGKMASYPAFHPVMLRGVPSLPNSLLRSIPALLCDKTTRKWNFGI
jgi:hypothetical protein